VRAQLSELTSRYAQDRILDVTCAVELAAFDQPEFHDRAARAQVEGDARDDHLLETAGLDLDHEPIVQRAAGLTTGSRREWR